MSRWERTETYSPAAMESAPASRPATPVISTIPDPAPAPATPMTSAALETSPSLTPNTVARRLPPEMPRWRWPTSLTEVGRRWPPAVAAAGAV